MEEINSDVFQNQGQIKLNVNFKSLDTRFSYQYYRDQTNFENIILYCPKISYLPSGYIGFIDSGDNEIRIIAKRDKFNFWDTNLRDIVGFLRKAIVWWKSEALISDEERMEKEIQQDNDRVVQDAYEDLRSDESFDHDFED